MNGHRKRVKHFHEPGDCHELTFSTFHQKPLLMNDLWRRMLCIAIDRGIAGHGFRLIAFVLMPEHVHLLVSPTAFKENGDPPIDDLLFAIKRPFSYRIKQLLIEERSLLLEELTIRERPGKTAFRFWQEGPGYDRNFSTERSVRKFHGIHSQEPNPTRAGRKIPRLEMVERSMVRVGQTDIGP